MPRPAMRPHISPTTIGELLFYHEAFNLAEAKNQYPWADRFVMGLPLAPWQREFKWSAEQCERFITSAWTGVFLGTYIMTTAEYRANDEKFTGLEYLPFTNMVIEGQQRLMALELYVTDRLAVPAANGAMTLWSEVGVLDKRRFDKTIFNKGLLKEDNEQQLRRFYDLLNFGGVAHLPHERASLTSDSLASETDSVGEFGSRPTS
jgi:hypothetical protein